MIADAAHGLLERHLVKLVAPDADASEAVSGKAFDRLAQRPLLHQGHLIDGEQSFVEHEGFRSQYVARPPERSNTAPVVKLHSGPAIHATIAAISSICRKRPMGMRLRQ